MGRILCWIQRRSREYVARPLDRLLSLVKGFARSFKNGSLAPADIATAALGFTALKSGRRSQIQST